MMPSSRLASLHASPAYQTAMADLEKLLQDTGTSVDCLLSKYTASSTKSSGPELLVVRTSLSMGVAPPIYNSRQEAQTNILHKDGQSVSNLGPTQLQASASNNVNTHGMENWYSPKQFDHRHHEKTSVSNDKVAFSDEDALRILLEEIKKTICNWSSRRKTLLQDRPSSSAAHDGVAVSPGLCLSNGAPSLLCSEEEQSPAIYISSLGAAKLGENGIEVHQNQKEEDKRCGDVHQKQIEEGKRGEIVHQTQNEEENRGGLLFQQDKEVGCLDNVANDTASQLQSDEQPMTVHLAAIEHESNAQVDTEVNVAATPSSKENGPAAENLLTSTSTEQTEVELPITKWTSPTSAAKTVNKSASFLRAVEVITSPDWLPEGWVTELKTRGSGNSAGSKDKYYVDPVSHRRFRSRKEVIAYIERGKLKSSDDSPETSPVKKFPAPELLPSFLSKSTKKAKLKESVLPSVSALPPPMVPSIASPGLLGNVFMPPFRTGQPSEWLVYESLASLPFPMFDPFYYTDFSANKSSSGKGSHVPTRPWFFTGPEASWSPLMDHSSLSKSGDKGRDYASYFSMPSYPSEGASQPSAGAAKKSSKRKSVGL